MARLRVIIYREGSDTVVEDIVVSDPDRNSGNLADVIVNRLDDHFQVDFTHDLISKGESV